MPSEQDDPLTTTTTTVDAAFTEDLDDDDDDDHNPSGEEAEEEDEDVDLIDDDDDDNDSTSSSAAAAVTIAVPGTTSTPPATISTPVSVSPLPRSDVVLDHQQHNIISNKRAVPLDESRRLFQRLWTDEDEIELLQGFLEYNNQRAVNNPYSHHHHHHHDTTAFYDQIKDKLQLDFNKNQLVEKLRRLKKKYRNVVSKISSGKEYVFKTAHDQITFDISSKIWNSEGGTILSTPVVYAADVNRFDDDETNNFSPNVNLSFNLNEQNGNGVMHANSLEKKVPVAPRSRKRSRSGGVKVEEKVSQPQAEPVGLGVGSSNVPNSVPNVVEETVKSCLLPLFKELLDGSSRGGLRGLGLGPGGMNLDPLGLGIGGLMNLPFGDVNDEKWRKQHILELEVCSKRLELVQDQIKSQLEELKAMRR